MQTLESSVSSFIAVASVVTIALLAAACSYPSTTRTGPVHDILVTEGPGPADLVVDPGDEVRWVNGRTAPIRVDLMSIKSDDLSCERGFSNIFGMLAESATIKPNQSASACFTKSGVVKYNLRMESAQPGGKAITSGVVRIGTRPQ
jgi:plastocyanin